MVTRIRRLAAASVVFFASGCCAPETKPTANSGAPTSSQAAQLLDSRLVILQGRAFELTVTFTNLRMPDGGNEPLICLAMNGDDRHVSFFTSSGPYRVTVDGASLKYGGHVFTVTPTQGSYVVDGLPVSLSELGRAIHCFVDGQYMGPEGF